MSDFNRPNLHYSVRLKPETQEEQLTLLARMVSTMQHILTTRQNNSHRTHSHHRTIEENTSPQNRTN